jgi:hypothetical protein
LTLSHCDHDADLLGLSVNTGLHGVEQGWANRENRAAARDLQRDGNAEAGNGQAPTESGDQNKAVADDRADSGTGQWQNGAEPQVAETVGVVERSRGGRPERQSSTD